MKNAMGKKLVLTEEQIKNVIGLNEDAFYYLGGSNPVGNTEIGVEGPLEDRLGIPQHSDDHVFGLKKHKKHEEDGDDEDDEFEFEYSGLDDMVTPTGYWSNRLGSHRTLASMSESKKKIDEDNQELKGLTLIYNDENGVKQHGSEEALIMQKNRAMKSGNKEKVKAIDQTLKNKREPIKRWKKFKKDVLGQENVYQKQGGTKNNSGTAHSKKNPSPLTTFFN